MSRPKWTYPYYRWTPLRVSLLMAAAGSTVLAAVLTVVFWAAGELLPFHAIFVLALVSAWRVFLVGLSIGDRGVRLRSLTRTRIVPWARIRGFVVDFADPPPKELIARVLGNQWDDNAAYGLFVELTDGSLVPAPIRLGPPPDTRGLVVSRLYFEPPAMQALLAILSRALAEHTARGA